MAKKFKHKKVFNIRKKIGKLERKFNKTGRKKIAKKISRHYSKLKHKLFGKKKRGPHSPAHRKAISDGLKRYHSKKRKK